MVVCFISMNCTKSWACRLSARLPIPRKASSWRIDKAIFRTFVINGTEKNTGSGCNGQSGPLRLSGGESFGGGRTRNRKYWYKKGGSSGCPYSACKRYTH